MLSRKFSAWKAGLLICGLLFMGKVNGEAASLEYGVYLTIQAESGEILYEKIALGVTRLTFMRI